MVWEALEAAKELSKTGISAEVINIHTIKPLDQDIVLESANKTKCVVSCEEHNIIGGLGESISRVLVNNFLCPMEFVGVNDKFGESGTPSELHRKPCACWQYAQYPAGGLIRSSSAQRLP